MTTDMCRKCGGLRVLSVKRDLPEGAAFCTCGPAADGFRLKAAR